MMNRLLDEVDRLTALYVAGGLVSCYVAGRFTLSIYRYQKLKQKVRDKREDGQQACVKLEKRLLENGVCFKIFCVGKTTRTSSYAF